jgi:hypothetical protein
VYTAIEKKYNKTRRTKKEQCNVKRKLLTIAVHRLSSSSSII